MHGGVGDPWRVVSLGLERWVVVAAQRERLRGSDGDGDFYGAWGVFPQRFVLPYKLDGCLRHVDAEGLDVLAGCGYHVVTLAMPRIDVFDLCVVKRAVMLIGYWWI